MSKNLCLSRAKIPPLSFILKRLMAQKAMSDQSQAMNNTSLGEECGCTSGMMSKEYQKNGQRDKQAPCSQEVGTSGSKNSALTIPSNFRVWEKVDKFKNNRPNSNSIKFKIMSYNVLAQYLLESHPDLYKDCSPSDLEWDVRSAHLYNEITSLDPDILCLQEVQASHLESFYSQFEKLGYCGVFKQRTGCKGDGCAIYFKQSLFELKDRLTVEFYQPELPLLNKDNVGIMVKLMPHNMPGSPIVVATTHLLFNPKRTDVRLAQMKLFLAEIDRFAYINNVNGSDYLPIILTGDFNSTPERAVAKLLSYGSVRSRLVRDGSDWRRIEVTDNCQHLSLVLKRMEECHCNTEFSHLKIYNSEYSAERPGSCTQDTVPADEYSHLFNSGLISYPLKLASVYQPYNEHKRDYFVTTFQDYWIKVDYIYYSLSSRLQLVKRWSLPTAKECAAVLGCLPNQVYGSDHLALAAMFELDP